MSWLKELFSRRPNNHLSDVSVTDEDSRKVLHWPLPRRPFHGCPLRRPRAPQESGIRDSSDYQPRIGYRREHSDLFSAQRTGAARPPRTAPGATGPFRRTKRGRIVCCFVVTAVRANQLSPEGVLFDLRMVGR